MRYSRVLTVLALIGVVGLTATLVTRGARSAPKPVRAARSAPQPVQATATISKLQSALQQQLQTLVASRRPPRPHVPQLALPPGAVPGGNPPKIAQPPAAQTCPVASGGCSIHPCVQFVQSGSQPAVSEVGQAVAAPARPGRVTPTLPGGVGSQGCTRHAQPHTLRVSSAVAPTLSVSAPQPSPRPGS